MSRILVLAPHPDDEAIGCGGALLRHGQQEDVVQVVFLTSGEKGGHGRAEADTKSRREGEARSAAHILGLQSIEFWGLPDGGVRASRAAVARLQAKLDDFKPDTVYVTHDREMHSDHRGAARLLKAALRAVRGNKHTKAWTPAWTPMVLGYEIWTPLPKFHVIVDISPFLKRKLRAVRAYRSQCAVVGFVEAVRGLNRYRGEMHSWPGGNYAEAFIRLKI